MNIWKKKKWTSNKDYRSNHDNLFFARSKYSDPLEELYPYQDQKTNLSSKTKPFVFFSNNKFPPRKLILIGLIVIAIFLLGGIFYFGWKISSVERKISIKNSSSSGIIGNIQSIFSPLLSGNHATLKGESSGRINILLLGKAGENHPGKNLTDTIIIMSIDTQKKKVALLSLPRDLYVNIPQTNSYTKINSLYQYGISSDSGIYPIKKSTEEITGLEIHYFLMVDFDGFTKIIDDIGGINVEVERDIFDPRYPGPNYSYETFQIKKGFHRMDGQTALKYARERHDDPEGDFGRAKRQQKIIQAVKNKIFSAQTFFNVFAINNILNTLGESIKTDISVEEMESFLWLSKKVDTQNITNRVVDAWKKDSILKVSHVYFGNTRAFVLVPRVGNYSEIQELAENIFNLDAIEKKMEKIQKENASLVIINQSGDSSLTHKIKEILKDKVKTKNITILIPQSPTSINKTLVVDNTDSRKIYTLDEIIKKLPGKLETGDAIIQYEWKDYDIAIFLGKDLIEKYKYEEDSLEDLNRAETDQQYLDLINN